MASIVSIVTNASTVLIPVHTCVIIHRVVTRANAQMDIKWTEMIERVLTLTSAPPTFTIVPINHIVTIRLVLLDVTVCQVIR